MESGSNTTDRRVGERVGKYMLQNLLGEDHLGKAFAALDTELGRPALVRLMPRTARQAQRLRELGQALLGLKHPNVVETYDCGEGGDFVFIASERPPEGSLQTLLHRYAKAGERLPLQQGLELVRDAAAALEEAHKRGIVHADVRPANLLLWRTGLLEHYTLKVGNFGMALLESPGGLEDLEHFKGVPTHLAPERFQGLPPTVHSDIYALGVVLYEVATGLLPFEAKDVRDAAIRHIYAQPVPPRQIVPQMPEALERVILRALAKKPIDRFTDMGELRDALQGLLDRSVPSQPRPTLRLSPEAAEVTPPSVTPPEGPSSSPRLSLCDAQGQVLRVIELGRGGLRIGRLEGNDVVLESERVSRHHLRVDWDGERVDVTDLGSTNGTWLYGGGPPRQLLPQAPSPWPWRSLVYLAPFWLRLDPPTSAGGQRIGVSLEAEELTLLPGEPARLRVKLINLGTLVDHFRPEVEGVPEAWLLERPEVQLNPGQQATVPLAVQVPRGPEARAGEYRLKVLARSRENPREAGSAPACWRILPFAEHRLSLEPPVATARRTAVYRVRLVNTGNAPARYGLLAGDEQHQLGYRFDDRDAPALELNERQRNLLLRWFRMATRPLENALRSLWERTLGPVLRRAQWYKQQLEEFSGHDPNARKPPAAPRPERPELAPQFRLEPGQSVEVPLRVRAPLRLFGAVRPYSFQVRTEALELPEGAEAKPLSEGAQFNHRGMLPAWTVPALLVLLGLLGWWWTRPPSITRFALEPAQPYAGQPVTLHYRVSGAKRLELRPLGISLDPQGERYALEKGFQAPADLTLVAYGRWRNSQERLAVAVRERPADPPVIEAFEATPRELYQGQPVLLRWKVRGAQSVTLEPLGTVKASGSYQDKPDATLTYRLVAVNREQRVERNLRVTVRVPAPRIEGFSIKPLRVTRGDGATLTFFWRTANAASVELDGVGTVGPSGSQQLAAPEQTTEFTLRARNAAGEEAVRKVRVEVVEPAVAAPPAPPPPSAGNPAAPQAAAPPAAGAKPAPVIERFQASALELAQGQKLTLSWKVLNARTVRIPALGPDPLPAQGSRVVTARASTTYTLQAAGEGGQAQQSLQVTVRPAPVREAWYDNIFGSIELEREGERVRGSYRNVANGAKGTIEGVLEAGVLRGTYTAGTSRRSFEWTLTPDGRGFNGVAGELGRWCGARKGSPLPDGCGYQGEWTTHFAARDNCSMQLRHVENRISGSFCEGSLSGAVRYEAGRMVAEGTWNSSITGAQGRFRFELTSIDTLQFRGNAHNLEWCGWREGLPRPAQCGLER